ncbi:hypothetical protein GPN2_20075 [Streptomyces murinus]
MPAKHSLTRALTELTRSFRSRDGHKPRPLDLFLQEGTAPETAGTVVEEVIREMAPDAASTDIDLISDLPWPSDAKAALTAINAPRTRAFTDELTVLLDVPLAPSVPNDQSTRRRTP